MQDPYIGEIRLFPYMQSDMQLWKICDGAALSTSEKVFQVIGYQFGGSGSQFNLPDLRAKVAVGVSPDYKQGVAVGNSNPTLIADNLPVHTHSIAVSAAARTKEPVQGNLLTIAANNEFAATSANPDDKVQMMAGSISVATGGGASFSTVQPYLGLAYYIAIAGIFPSRS